MKLVVEDALLVILVQEGMIHYPNEYGGVLVGRYSDDLKTCFVEESVSPRKHKSSTSTFERGQEGIVERLLEFYNQRPQFIYLGEWHTHPNNLPIPSRTDKQAMRQIANDKHVNITSPILIILGLEKNTYSVGIYIQFNNKILKYEQQ